MHEQRTGARILAALADAPMNDEALLHELEVTRRSLGQALGHLRRIGTIQQDDQGCWHLANPDAAARWKAEAMEPPLAKRPSPDAIADVVHQLTAARPPVSISTGDQVLQVLIAAGRITADDVRLASTLIGSRT